jgi:hypothetical protein
MAVSGHLSAAPMWEALVPSGDLGSRVPVPRLKHTTEI